MCDALSGYYIYAHFVFELLKLQYVFHVMGVTNNSKIRDTESCIVNIHTYEYKTRTVDSSG